MNWFETPAGIAACRAVGGIGTTTIDPPDCYIHEPEGGLVHFQMTTPRIQCDIDPEKMRLAYDLWFFEEHKNWIYRPKKKRLQDEFAIPPSAEYVSDLIADGTLVPSVEE